MKKFKLILSMAVIAFSVSLTACGESNNEESDKQTVTEETTKERGTISNEQIEALKSGANKLSESLISCGNSNEALLDKYQAICNELVEAVKSGDEAKIKEITEKGEKLEKELEGRDLTDEEKQQIEKITQEAAAAVLQNIPGFDE